METRNPPATKRLANAQQSEEHSDDEGEIDHDEFNKLIQTAFGEKKKNKRGRKAGEGAAKKGKDHRWTTKQMELLVGGVYKEDAYIRRGPAFPIKYGKIMKALETNENFKDYEWKDKTWQSFQRQFDRIYDKFVEEKALEKEGANLSGLDYERMTPIERCLLDIFNERKEMDEDKIAQTEKEKKKKAQMKGHEKVFNVFLLIFSRMV